MGRGVKRERTKTHLLVGGAAIVLLCVAVGWRQMNWAGQDALRPDCCTKSCCVSSKAADKLAQASDITTLDPDLFEGDVREAYKVARENPDLLAQLHCYCGCDRYEGHRNLLDCYRDQHGSRCEICVGEALDAQRLFAQGTPVEQIRDILRAKWGRSHGG